MSRFPLILPSHGAKERKAHAILSCEYLADCGQEATCLESLRPRGRLLFARFDASFDCMFVTHAGISNPFGINGLDLKAFYLGGNWPQIEGFDESAKRHLWARYPVRAVHNHSALDDACEQAELRPLRASV